MKTLFLIMLLLVSRASFADSTYTESKRLVWKLAYERTLFKIVMDNSNGTKSPKELAKGILEASENIATQMDKKGEWNKMTDPVRGGCISAVSGITDANPSLSKDEKSFYFVNYCGNELKLDPLGKAGQR
jgi:hypothetical protein